jgi:hypothetical protein
MSLRRMVVVCSLAASAFGCATTARITLNDRAAQTGSAVATAAVAALDHVAATEDDLGSKQRMLKIAGGSLTVEQAIDPGPPHYGEELNARIAAFEALNDTYSALGELSGSTSPADIEIATGRLAGATNNLTALPAGLRTDLGDLSARLTSLVQARSLRERNEMLADIASRYGRLWRADIPLLSGLISEDLKEYQRLMLALSPDRFDAVHLASTVKQPFARELNASFYKVESIETARADQEALEVEMSGVGRALELLASIHRQLSRAGSSAYEVTSTLDQIDRILGVKKP